MSALTSASNVRSSTASALPSLMAGSSMPSGQSAGVGTLTSFSELLRESSMPKPNAHTDTPAPQAATAPAPAPMTSASHDNPVSSADGKTQSQREDARLNAKRAAATPPAAPQHAAAKTSANRSETTDTGKPQASGDAESTSASADTADKASAKDDASQADASDKAAETQSSLLTTPVAPAADDTQPLPDTTAAAAAAAAALAQDKDAAGDKGVDKGDADALLPGAARGGALTSTGARTAALQLGSHERQVASATADAAAATTDQHAAAAAERADDKQASFASALTQATKGMAGASGEARGAGGDMGVLANGASAAMTAGGANEANAVKPGSSNETVRSVNLPQPLNDASFAPAMAARLSLLAADGVSEAKLHLNPADMGPVSVQIVVDGQQAQISFHAEQAETRAVLERSLPDLAAALRDNGLTLSGGGVFQQQSGQNQDTSARDGGGTNSRASLSTSTAKMDDGRSAPVEHGARLVTRTLLDIYA